MAETYARREGLSELIGDRPAAFIDRQPGARQTDAYLKGNREQRSRLAELLRATAPLIDQAQPGGQLATVLRGTRQLLPARYDGAQELLGYMTDFLSPTTMAAHGIDDPVALGLELTGVPSVARLTDDAAHVVPGSDGIMAERPSRIEALMQGDAGAGGMMALDALVAGGMGYGAARVANPRPRPVGESRFYTEWRAQQDNVIAEADAVRTASAERLRAASDVVELERKRAGQDAFPGMMDDIPTNEQLRLVERLYREGGPGAETPAKARAREALREYQAHDAAYQQARTAESPHAQRAGGDQPFTSEEAEILKSERITGDMRQRMRREEPPELGMPRIGDEMTARAREAQAAAPRVEPHALPEDSGLARQAQDPAPPDTAQRMQAVDDVIMQREVRDQIAALEAQKERALVGGTRAGYREAFRIDTEIAELRRQIELQPRAGTGVDKASASVGRKMAAQDRATAMREKPPILFPRRRISAAEREADDLLPVGERTKRVAANMQRQFDEPRVEPRANESARVREQRAVLHALADDLDPAMTRQGTPARDRRTMRIDERTEEFNAGLRQLAEDDAAILAGEVKTLESSAGRKAAIESVVEQIRQIQGDNFQPRLAYRAGEKEADWLRAEARYRNNPGYLERIQTKKGQNDEAVAMVDRRMRYEQEYRRLNPRTADDLAMHGYDTTPVGSPRDYLPTAQAEIERIARAVGQTGRTKKRVPPAWDERQGGVDPKIRAPRQEAPDGLPEANKQPRSVWRSMGDRVAESAARRRGNAALRTPDLRNAATDPRSNPRAVRQREKLIDEYISEPDMYQGPAAARYSRIDRANQAVKEYRAAEAYQADMRAAERAQMVDRSARITAGTTAGGAVGLGGVAALAHGKETRHLDAMRNISSGPDLREVRANNYDAELREMLGDEWDHARRRGLPSEVAEIGRQASETRHPGEASRFLTRSGAPQEVADAFERAARGEMRPVDAPLVEEAIDYFFQGGDGGREPIEDLSQSTRRAEMQTGVTAKEYLDILDAGGEEALYAALDRYGIETLDPEEVARLPKGAPLPETQARILELALQKRGLQMPDEYGGRSIVRSPLSDSDDAATIADVQRALKIAGLYTGAIDGEVGPQTTRALEQLREITEREYTLDDEVGREASRQAANRVVPRAGSVRDLTADMQRQLELAGYGVGDSGPDGIFGRQTMAAYNAALADAGLPPLTSLPNHRDQVEIERLYADLLGD